MINGKYPLLLIEINNIPIPFYLDETIFKIAVQGEDSSISLSTTKTGSKTTQIIDNSSLVLNFKASKSSQYTVILLSLITKIYNIFGNAFNFYKYSDYLSDEASKIDYSISYFSDTDSITDAVITSFTKVSDITNNTVNISITLEKKVSSVNKSVDLTGTSSSIGTQTITKIS